MGEATLFLETSATTFVERALMWEQTFFPTGQKHAVEFETLRRMQGHDIDGLLGLRAVTVHYKRYVFEKALQVLEFLHRPDQFLEVFQASGSICGTVLLPHVGVTGLIEHYFREFGMRDGILLGPPALKGRHEVTQRKAGFRLHLVSGRELAGCLGQGNPPFARVVVQHLQGGVAEAALWHIDNALEGKIVCRLRDDAQIGEGVANFSAFVEARAADYPIGQSELDKAVFKFTHLE